MIAKAKVPIIKFEEVPSTFNFDISFDVANGPVAAEFVGQLMQQLPAMRPLLLVLKIFLQQREFNEVGLLIPLCSSSVKPSVKPSQVEGTPLVHC